MATIYSESVAFAALSISQELAIALLKRGVLKHDDVDEIFAKAIEAQTAMRTPVNDGAAELLKEYKTAVEWEWPRRGL